MDKFFFSAFNHALPTFKVRPVSPEFRVEADWLNALHHKRKLLCWPADVHSVTRSRTCHPRAVYLQQELLSGGPKGGICRVSRTDVDMPMRTFINLKTNVLIGPVKIATPYRVRLLPLLNCSRWKQFIFKMYVCTCEMFCVMLQGAVCN